jgi:hypothetical protein
MIQLEDFLHTSLFPDLLPQTVGGFINHMLRGLLLIRNKLRCLHNSKCLEAKGFRLGNIYFVVFVAAVIAIKEALAIKILIPDVQDT